MIVSYFIGRLEEPVQIMHGMPLLYSVLSVWDAFFNSLVCAFNIGVVKHSKQQLLQIHLTCQNRNLFAKTSVNDQGYNPVMYNIVFFFLSNV